VRLLAEIHVFDRAVPWSPPRTILSGPRGTVGRKHIHKKGDRLCAWQDTVRVAMRHAYAGEPYEGPVLLRITFVRGTDDKALWGKRWWNARPARGHADMTNLLKSTEDALKTYRKFAGTGRDRVLVLKVPGVIEEDSQVCDATQRKRYGPRDAALVRVYALETTSCSQQHRPEDHQ
jgi:Holliday junction resolvase RusA-like endonuclease